MKKTIYMLMSVAAMMLASCSQSEELVQTGISITGEDVQVTFNVEIPEMQTRAVDADADETTVNRYICQIWEGSEVSAEQKPERTIEQAVPDFTMLLKKDTQYTLLLWADRGNVKTEGQTDADAGNYYDTSNLMQVKVNHLTTEDEGAGLAFYACQPVNVTSTADITGPVELKHAVAKVCLYETNIIAPNSSLSVKSPVRTFNAADGIVSDNMEETVMTFALEADGVDATAATGGTRIASFYVLAPEKEKSESLSSLTFTLTEPQDQVKLRGSKETKKTVSNVPLQANYVTNIRGEFSDYTNKTFNVSLNETWGSETYEFVDMANFTTTDEYKAFFERQGKKGTLRITGNVTTENISLMGEALHSSDYSYILDFSGVKSIEQFPYEGFDNSLGLKGVILPEGITEIKSSCVFARALNLEFVKLPASLKIAGYAMFLDCQKLVSVNMDETGVTEIPKVAFEGCTALERIVLGNVTSIGSEAFGFCHNLKELDLSRCDQVPNIGDRCFQKANNIPNLKVYVKSEDMIDEFVRVWSAKDSEFTKDNFVVKQ